MIKTIAKEGATGFAHLPALLRGFFILEGFLRTSGWFMPPLPLGPGPCVSICILSSLSEAWLLSTFFKLISYTVGGGNANAISANWNYLIRIYSPPARCVPCCTIAWPSPNWHTVSARQCNWRHCHRNSPSSVGFPLFCRYNPVVCHVPGHSPPPECVCSETVCHVWCLRTRERVDKVLLNKREKV